MRRQSIAAIFGVAALAACGPIGQHGPGPYETLSQDLTVCDAGVALKGVDVSSFQPGIQWATVKSSGLSFGIAKATEGLTLQDSEFATNWTGMKAAGLVRGAYHFLHPDDGMGAAQADFFLSTVGTFQPGDLPPFLDWETSCNDSGGNCASAANTLTVAQDFIDEIQAKTGLPTIIYTYPSYWTGLGTTTQFGAYPLWMASYAACPDIPAPWTNWLFWQYSASGSVSGISCGSGCDVDEFNGSLSQLQQIAVGGDGGIVINPPDGGSTLPSTVLPQDTGNDAITLVNWTDEHMEVFAKGAAGAMLHSGTTGTGDSWSALAQLDTGAECGSAAAFWGAAYLYPELYSPLTAGGAGHLWWTAGTWNTYQSLGGTGLSHLSTLVWPSGLVEVFALGSDGAAWYDSFDTSTVDWAGWTSLGGSGFSQGPRGLVWSDGHGELYEVDSSGNVWQSQSASGSGEDWTAFVQLGSGIASRLSPVRWPDGTVEIFGRGTDGNVWRDTATGTTWSGFTKLATQAIAGEPSAFMNPGSGAEVVARDPSGNVLDLVYSVASGSWPASFTGLGETSASDPFAWIRGDGNAEVFAVDGSGNLVHSLRSAGSWGSWGTIGSGIDSCSSAVTVVDGGAPDSGPGSDGGVELADAGADAGEGHDAGVVPDAGRAIDAGEAGDGGGGYLPPGPQPNPFKGNNGCGCGSSAADVPAFWLFAAIGALLRRRRRG